MSKLIIGLGGGIGSGKTAVSDYFHSKHGIDIIDADVCSRIVVEPGRPALEEIKRHFGDNILLDDGQLDRAALRKIIFSQPEEKQWLENLLHPLIFEEIIRQIEAAGSPYCILVSPLLVEGGQKSLCHKILIVDAPETTQVQRTMARDNNNKEQVEAIMATQASREQRLNAADFVIENSGSLDDLHSKVDELHRQLLQLSANTP